MQKQIDLTQTTSKKIVKHSSIYTEIWFFFKINKNRMSVWGSPQKNFTITFKNNLKTNY